MFWSENPRSENIQVICDKKTFMTTFVFKNESFSFKNTIVMATGTTMLSLNKDNL